MHFVYHLKWDLCAWVFSFFLFFHSLDSWSLGWIVRVIANLNVKIDCSFSISLSVPIATETNQQIQTLKLFFRVSFIFIIQFLWNFRSDLVLSVDRFSLMNRSHQFDSTNDLNFSDPVMFVYIVWCYGLTNYMPWHDEQKRKSKQINANQD